MRTIDITTTQNVTIEYELASLRERFLAFFIDLLIIGAIYVVLLIIFVFLLDFDLDGDGMFGRFISYLPLGIMVLYQLLSEIIGDGQSWGKRALGLKVVRLDGKQPSLSDYLLRAVFHMIDTILSMGIVAALLISSSSKSQRLGDMTANTTVIRIKFSLRFRLEDILKINSIEDYEPKYPQVRQLSEEDMLQMKTLISRHQRYRNAAHREVVNELVENLVERLGIQEKIKDDIEFLKTLIRDYIVLTR